MEAKLILEDGTIFKGEAFGFPKDVDGEVVFTTGMVGYPESITDPSYKGQILVFTYPLIGNYGIPDKKETKEVVDNFESQKVQVSGIIVSCLTNSTSHWQARQSLEVFLKKNQVPGLYGLDTRFLTQKLRQKGTMLGKILLKEKIDKKLEFFNPNLSNLVAQVSCSKIKIYKNGKKRLLLIDCGTKLGIIRSLLQLKNTVIQVPWNYDPFLNNLKFDGVVISNGPGDPQKVPQTIKIIKKIMKKGLPILGICLGNQLLALAAGGETYKLKYGHRSQNQPCLLKGTKKAFITSQNHGYTVRASSLPDQWKEWFINLNDKTNEGIIHNSKPFCAVQFHPEACPGPSDTQFIFKDFLAWI